MPLPLKAKKTVSAAALMEKEGGPFFGSKESSLLFPAPLTHWLNAAGYSLLLVLLLACGFQFYRVVFPAAAPSTALTEQEMKPEPVPLLSTQALKPFLQYAELFRRREVFKIYEKAVPPAPPAVAKETLAQLAAGLTLSGIIFEDVPQAILEDKKSGKTHFLKKGDYLNKIKIEEIERGKVRLRYESETMELEL